MSQQDAAKEQANTRKNVRIVNEMVTPSFPVLC